MKPQQPILLDPYPRADPAQERNFGGWIALVVMFSVMLSSAVFGSIARSKDAKFGEFDDQLKEIVQQAQAKKSADMWLLASGDKADTKKDLRDLEMEMAKRTDLDAYGTAIYAAVLVEEKKPVPTKLIQVLLKGKMDATRAMGALYSSPTLTAVQAHALAQKLRTNKLFVAKLAEIQALEKSGDKGARSRLLPQKSAGVVLLLGGGMLLLLFGCVVAWFGYFAGRSSGLLTPLGLKNGGITTAKADRFAVRAAQLFGGYLLISLITELAFQKVITSPWAEISQGVAVLAFVFVLPAIPLGGGKLSLEALGIGRENLGKNILWGVVGFVAELPVAMILALIVTSLLKFLPTPEHPASVQLQQNHDPLSVAGILLLGTIVAPIWEEIMFRGLLFPALSKVFRSIPIGAVVSSLIFASIHPQGAGLWLALGTTGMMGCALTYQTKSLVPSIVMHFCHNMALMIATLLVS